MFFKKETLTQVFSCDFFNISENTFFIEHLRTTASLIYIAGSGRAVYSHLWKHSIH